MRKPTRTISGVAPLAVMLPPKACPHGVCTYCPSLNAPQSYTPESPVVLRAKKVNYSPNVQVKERLNTLNLMGHPTDKIELIIMGGTFLSYSKEFQRDFIKKCYDALNIKISKNLKDAKKLNETAKHRCVALCIETRPDFCSTKEIKRILEFGCTRVELGVQAIDDKIYKIINRGHTLKDVIQASEILKRHGFKVGFHMMPGLPGSTPKKDLQMFKELFKNQNFRPDQLKIYPCQVIKGSKLEILYKEGKYKPYSKKVSQKLITKMMQIVPEYCRVMRIMREIPNSFLIAGITNMDLRKDIEEEIRKRKLKIKEIRFREIGFVIRDNLKINRDIKLKTIKYNASKGKEFFLEIVNKNNILFGLLRLRINEDKSAIIREVHVYGQALDIGKKALDLGQHVGFGKMLVKEAEKIVLKEKTNLLKIISGVGVREYYKNLGYSLNKEGYMEKKLLS